MNKNEKIKKVVFIFLGALASGYFMYSGFSILMSDEPVEVNASNGLTDLLK